MALVIVAEDDDLLRGVLEQILMNEGYLPFGAKCVEQAKALLDAYPDFDALLTDIMLAQESKGGIMVGQYARRINPHASIIYTSGHRLTGILSSTFVAGYTFLPKPYAAEELLSALRKSGRSNSTSQVRDTGPASPLEPGVFVGELACTLVQGMIS